MNGIHDMGGMHGMGPVVPEPNEPVFHAPWEARVYALSIALGASVPTNLDAIRHEIENLPPAQYLSLSYYEKWLKCNIEALVLKHGLVTSEEMRTGVPARGSVKAQPVFTLEALAQPQSGTGYMRPEAPAVARFEIGQRVRALNLNPVGATRLPRYVRGKCGVVTHKHGIFVFPDTNAHFMGEQPQHLYCVQFTARELWGEDAPARDSVSVDLWDSYLEHA
jgi:nitrile hydratase beta subunit